MKQAIFFLVISLFLASPAARAGQGVVDPPAEAAATCQLSGRVADHLTGESLPGVLVRIEGTEKVAYTDFEGNFCFADLPGGEYSLSFEYVSYRKTFQRSLRLEPGQSKAIQLGLAKI